MQKKLKKIWNGVNGVLITAAALLAIALVGIRLIGIEPFVVLSGSMEPEYPVGSMVYVREAEAAELEVGDVVTFNIGNGVRGTHRIIEVIEENGKRSFLTKGDANEYADNNPIFPGDIVGKVIFSLPYLGYLAAFIQQPAGRYAMIAVLAVLLLLLILPDLIFPEPKEQEETK